MEGKGTAGQLAAADADATEGAANGEARREETEQQAARAVLVLTRKKGSVPSSSVPTKCSWMR